jgi:hypothetical protein
VSTIGNCIRAAGWRVFIAAILIAVTTSPIQAQRRPDTSRVAVDTSGPRPERKPPLSPRRAFLYSLLLPGYAQSVLGRTRAGTLIVAFESVALIMVRQSAADVHEARVNALDSVAVSFVDANGAPSVRYEKTEFPAQLLKVRRAHLEDWLAVLAASHLFAAADAYVASLLWDLPAEVSLRASPRRTEFAFRVYW